MSRVKLTSKEEAQQALCRGEWKRALEHFQHHCAQEPGDFRSQLKVAELLERLGQKEEAVQMYRKVAEAYAHDGFLLQAISINKMMLRIDPSSQDAHQRLAQLYAEKTREIKPLRPFPYIPLFSELDEGELQTILPHVQSKTFLMGSLICREGERGDSLFVISRGEVSITKRTPEGREVSVRNLREGSFFGEFGYFIDQKRHATVRVVSECEILEITRNVLNRMIETHPRLKEVLQTLFEERILDNLFAVSPVFSSLTSKERAEVLKRFFPQKVPEGTFLFKGGDPPASLYMVRSGEVEIFTQNRRGKKVLLAILESGNFFGEIGPLLDKPRTANARTTCPTELMEMTKEDFKTCLHRFPNLRTKLKEISLNRLSRTNELLSQEAIQKAKETMV
ncbi:MAG TPA: cyclic nucleotide-binding domain-containing protein [Thermodesulfobacteriota bacterium]|nr:cyclic nucleotide-binding domain-containing protein [Thermodesulfobacteriota bacterium]